MIVQLLQRGAVADANIPRRTLDPCAFLGVVASRIAGLGGAGDAPDAFYAFHTPYLVAPAERLRFEGRFDGLETGSGWITIQINMEPPGAAAAAQPIVRKRMLLRTLARNDGAFTLECAGQQGARYAALGFVSRGAEASARGLELGLLASGRPYPAAAPEVTALDPRSAIAHLYSTEPATIESPVWQMCTASQLDEPAYASWLGRLHEPQSRHRKQWEFIYVLRALEVNGCLQPGKRGLGFGVGHEPLPAAMAARGVSVVATDLPADHADAYAWRDTAQHLAGLEQLRRTQVCDDEQLAAHVSFQAADMRTLPSDLKDFDFLWSACALEHLGSIEAGLRFIEDSLACLKPGGVAVHTTEFNLSSVEHTLDHHATVLFRRPDIERLAQRLIAAGHQIAPIKLDPGNEALDQHIDLPPYVVDPHLKIALDRFVTTSFGIIIRKGATSASDTPHHTTESSSMDVIEAAPQSSGDRDYLIALYGAVFDREPDEPGLQHNLHRLASGVSREDMLRTFLTSDEYNERLDRIHRFRELDKLGDFTSLSRFPLDFSPPGEAGRSYRDRIASGFLDRYCGGPVVLDVGFNGYDNPEARAALPHAIGIDLDYPGYDGIRLPFDDGSVDTVFSSHCLEHILFDHAAIRDWHRVLKVGGFIVCMVPNQALYEKKRFLPSNWNADHKRMYTPSSLLHSFEEALDVNSYRVRHLRENDRNYDYSKGPEEHPSGAYEIELVVEKLRTPTWTLA